MEHLTDTQNEADHREIPIDRVGVKGLRHPLEFVDRDGRVQHTIASMTLAVDLPVHLKGTHMSRFVEAMLEHGTRLGVDSALELPRDLLGRLGAKKACVIHEFTWFRSKAAPVSGKHGWMDYEVRFEVDLTADGKSDFILTVMVPVATLCPCSKAISARGAHNQRGMVTYSVRSDKPMWVEDLVDIVEASASCELYSVLKRPDEKAVTERAYDNPVFVEDVVRNVASRSDALESVTWYRVEVENFESIHNHSAYAVIERRR
jgi:GTP cyclohydrolase IB